MITYIVIAYIIISLGIGIFFNSAILSLFWPFKLLLKVYGLIACKLRGHINNDYDIWYGIDNSNSGKITKNLHCYRCGKLLEQIPLD
jgi:hypothetical protein